MKFLLLTFSFAIFTQLFAQSNIIFFDTRNEFEDSCPADSLTFEDFANGPAEFSACSGPISAQGDDCYEPGEIQTGFEITTNLAQSQDLFFIPAGSFGVRNNAVGADAFPAHTILNFTDSTSEVNAVGFDLYSALGDGAPIKLSIFGTQGLIDSVIFDVPQDAPFFVGMQSSEPIVSIEFENLDLVLEHIALLSFGNCQLSSNTSESSLIALDYYPNPVRNILSLRSDFLMQNVSVFDVAGKEMQTIDGSSSSLEVDMSELPAGVYLLRVVVEQVANTYKIVKE